MNDFIIKKTPSGRVKSQIQIQEIQPVEVKKIETSKIPATLVNAKVYLNNEIKVKKINNNRKVLINTIEVKTIKNLEIKVIKKNPKNIINNSKELEEVKGFEVSHPHYVSKIRQKLNQDNQNQTNNSNLEELKNKLKKKPKVKAKLKNNKEEDLNLSQIPVYNQTINESQKVESINNINDKLQELKKKHHFKSVKALAAEKRLESALNQFHSSKNAKLKIDNLTLKAIKQEIKTHQHTQDFSTDFEAPKIQNSNLRNKPKVNQDRENVSIKFNESKIKEIQNQSKQINNIGTPKAEIKAPIIVPNKIKQIESQNPNFNNLNSLNGFNSNYKKDITNKLNQLQTNSKPEFKIKKNSLGKEIFKVKNKKQGNLLVKIAAAFLPIALILGSIAGMQSYNFFNSSQSAVAGVSEVIETPELSPEEESFNNWKKSYTSEDLKMDEDTDQDGLINIDEFNLDTNPINAFTCDQDKKQNDLQNLLNLINPKTCKKLDLNNEEDLKIFSKIISKESVQNEILDINASNQETEKTSVKADDLKSVFGVKTYNEIDKLNQNNLENSINSYKLKKEYLEKIEKIDQYITKNRSYDIYDKDYATPAHPAAYLETSLKYKTPLKYVLAIARLESRFGTDRFTNSGNPTRIHNHQNVFSMGLDDSGNNITFSSWEEGINSFGRWYQYFENKGVSDCQKWKIYNPNGDYCAKVEATADKIQVFLES